MTETKTQRNIYEKMSVIKIKLLGIKKGGKNDFSHYSYFELGDILPVLTPALQEERLYMKTQFSATEQIAKLVIVDIDNTESKIEFEIKFAECNLKGAHEIQNLGAAQTYTRRYLIMTAFDIAEADLVDAGAEKDDKKPEQKKNQQTPAQKPQQTKQETEKPEEELTKLKANAWELIKMLPTDQQTALINSCKTADEKALKKIIEDLLKQAQETGGQTPQDNTAKTTEAEMEIF
jgi:heme-binding NEAT domain protein